MKLVGRVSVDLSEIVNSLHQNQPKSHKLDYCSVNATVTFGTKFIGKKLSSTPPENFDKDSFSDFESFVAGIHNIK